MRLVETIPHPKLKIVVYALEYHFYIEIEAGPMKQCYKLPKEKAENVAAVRKWLDEEFLNEVYKGFESMYTSHKNAMARNFA